MKLLIKALNDNSDLVHRACVQCGLCEEEDEDKEDGGPDAPGHEEKHEKEDDDTDGEEAGTEVEPVPEEEHGEAPVHHCGLCALSKVHRKSEFLDNILCEGAIGPRTLR